MLLLAALLWTLAAKLLAVRGLGRQGSATALFQAALPDVAFFGAIAGLFSLSYLWAPGKLVARVTLAAALLVLLWSMLVYWPYVDRLFEYDLVQDPQEQSPRTITGPEKELVAARVNRWKEASQIEVPVSRFRQRLLYRHWRTFSSGRTSWAYYVPSD